MFILSEYDYSIIYQSEAHQSWIHFYNVLCQRNTSLWNLGLIKSTPYLYLDLYMYLQVNSMQESCGDALMQVVVLMVKSVQSFLV